MVATRPCDTRRGSATLRCGHLNAPQEETRDHDLPPSATGSRHGDRARAAPAWHGAGRRRSHQARVLRCRRGRPVLSRLAAPRDRQRVLSRRAQAAELGCRRMRENTLKQRLYAGKAAFGVMCTFPSPPVVEMLGHLGFDWILLDNEHGSITVDTAEACIVAAELSGMAPIARPVGNKAEIIAPFLDRGAWGVQVPHVNTADEARAAVDAVKYGPEGHRGIFSGGRPAGYGFKGGTAGYGRGGQRHNPGWVGVGRTEG